jgi:hypothetical protein|tara:strand:+ start:2927 stop:3286 length:360 start_codon:yes stop_codon:yes gene_type:complete
MLNGMTVGEVLKAEKMQYRELVETLKEKYGIKRNWEYDLIMYNQVTVDKDKLDDMMRMIFDLAYLRGMGSNISKPPSLEPDPQMDLNFRPKEEEEEYDELLAEEGIYVKESDKNPLGWA